MSSHGSKPEQAPAQQADTTSAPTQETLKEVKMEVKPVIPVFSYAQAAKSKVPSVPATPSIGVAKSDAGELATKRDTEPRSAPSASGSQIATPKRATSEGAKPRNNDFKAGDEPPLSKKAAPDPPSKDVASQTQAKTATTADQNMSTTSQPPNSGRSTSASTIPKDDAGLSTMNGSTESTWDKQAPSSQNGSKNGEATDAENESALKESEAIWDEPKPESASLKEAPPPPVNFWAQRMAQNPKPKPQQTAAPQAVKPPTVANGTAGSVDTTKSSEVSGEPKIRENRKRSKGNSDDRSTNKEGNKSTEGRARNGEGSNKANAGTMAPPPPPPGDAVSWPTPDTAIEEKKKSQPRMEKDDKEKTPTAKPHGKKEWQTVPFVPTVNFNTPMPTSRSRGGRGASGAGRENGGRGRNGNGVDKATSTSANASGSSTTAIDDRGKGSISSSSVAPSTSQRSKRASSAGPTVPKELRRPGDFSGGERRKDSELNSVKSNQNVKGAGSSEPRRPFATTSNETQTGKSSSGRGYPRETMNPPRRSQTFDDGRNPQEPSSATPTTSKAAEPERRGEGYGRSQESIKDSQGGSTTRERGEGRSERGGRGGYRGRGGSNFNPYNSHPPNGQGFSGPPSSQYQQPMTGLPSRSFSNHERLSSQSQGPFYPTTGQPPNRSYRSNSRSHSIQHPYGRYPHQPHGGPPHLPNLQTDLANTYVYPYEPQPGSMSALPYTSYMPGPNLFGMVAVQMEYYFSVDNLCKDTYLRKNMNSQGWVPLELVAGFNRIKQLTPEIAVVQDVCFSLSTIETRFAEDASVWLRKRVDWQQWVMEIETRVPEAQNDGPQFAPFQPFNSYGPSQPYQDNQEMSPRSAATSVPLHNVQYQSLDGTAAPIQQVVMAPPPHQNGMHSGSQVPLSAAVSEFSPSVRSPNGRVEPHPNRTNIISNEEMDKHHITYQEKSADQSAPDTPQFPSASTRTLSNGSVDEPSKLTERQSRPLVNGETPDSDDRSMVNRSRSPYSVGSPGRHVITPSMPVIWSKNKEHLSRMNKLSSECSSAAYPVFRQSALSQRERVTDICVYDMQVLYSFWAHFLIRNFNLHAYEEFHRMAMEDEEVRHLDFGMKKLNQYYEESLLGQRTIPNDGIARDFIQIVKKESTTGERSNFKRLRAAWRNGAWNAKNRSKISKIIDTDLNAELDR